MCVNGNLIILIIWKYKWRKMVVPKQDKLQKIRKRRFKRKGEKIFSGKVYLPSPQICFRSFLFYLNVSFGHCLKSPLFDFLTNL